MKIMSIGGGFVSEHLSYDKIPERITTDSDSIDQILRNHKPDVLINCIGRTGRPNIDWCESHKEETSYTNTVIPIRLAEACARFGTHLIQIGSGCIYFGQSPNSYQRKDIVDITGRDYFTWVEDRGWVETDFANPKSYYSKSKFACDLALGDLEHVTTLRIRMPISTLNNQRNLINKLRGYSQVIDIPNSMTFMDDLVRCIDWAAQNRKTGIYHVVNPEPITAAEVMREYQKYVPAHQFEIISERQLDDLTTAKRSNCILNGDKLKKEGFQMTPSMQGLENCMREYVKNL